MTEREMRLKRARMRAWRRGMREMDLILGSFIDDEGAALDDGALGDFERLIERPDQGLYVWISSPGAVPPEDADAGEHRMIAAIRRHREGVALALR